VRHANHNPTTNQHNAALALLFALYSISLTLSPQNPLPLPMMHDAWCMMMGDLGRDFLISSLALFAFARAAETEETTA
jgi:hypothetical protein